MDLTAAKALAQLQKDMTAAQATFLAALEQRNSIAMKAASERCALLFEQIRDAQQAAASASTGRFSRAARACDLGKTAG